MTQVYAVATIPEPDAGVALSGLPAAQDWLRMGGAGSIGWPSDETVVILSGTDAGAIIALLPDDAVDVHCLVPTVRPTDNRPPVVEGVVALRWFELAAGDWDEFIDLSVGAWPAFEASFDATILGLFRATDVEESEALALLVTRYASLAVWEESRATLAARSGALAESGRRFLRRHDLTRRSVVRIGRPIQG